MATTNPPAAEADDLDALFNDYSIPPDPFDTPILPYSPPSPPPRTRPNPNASLGLDAPLTLPTRAPRPKLDTERLLSTRGIPKLRQRARALRIKGRGHEYADAERLLGMYQLWLDDLYPKARFKDALVMVEKLGHKKDVVVMRRAWIDEGRPGRGGGVGADADVDLGDGEAPRDVHERAPTQGDRIAPIFTEVAERAAARERQDTPDGDADVPADLADLYDATPRRAPAGASGSIFGPGAGAGGTGATAGGITVEGEEEEDDLDALLAEADMAIDPPAAAVTTAKSTAPQDDDFDDEMSAMADMGW